MSTGLSVFAKAPVNFTSVGKFKRSFSLKGFGGGVPDANEFEPEAAEMGRRSTSPAIRTSARERKAERKKTRKEKKKAAKQSIKNGGIFSKLPVQHQFETG